MCVSSCRLREAIGARRVGASELGGTGHPLLEVWWGLLFLAWRGKQTRNGAGASRSASEGRLHSHLQPLIRHHDALLAGDGRRKGKGGFADRGAEIHTSCATAGMPPRPPEECVHRGLVAHARCRSPRHRDPCGNRRGLYDECWTGGGDCIGRLARRTWTPPDRGTRDAGINTRHVK